MAGGDVIPPWTRWPFRVLRVGAFVMAVAAVLFALAGDWWPVATTTGIAVWIAVYPWTWKIAYRLGYANGQLEPLVEWDQT
jgi:hypothetical protein